MTAIVYFVHGLGMYLDYYDAMFEEFGRHGIRVHSFDLRGHGETFALNKGRMFRGDLVSVETLKSDVKLLLEIDRAVACPKFIVSAG